MRARSTSAAFLIVLLAVACGVTACRSGGLTLPATDVVYCTIVADPPAKDGGRLAAAGHYACDGGGATSLTFTVTLQKLKSDGVSWSSITSQTWSAKGINTTRQRTEATRTRKVFAACDNSGWYRSFVHAVEVSNGHRQTYDSRSVRVPHPCKSAF